jgi:DNA gyrase subunit B
LEKGYVYAAVPPLYKATMGTKIQYLKDDAALETFRKSIGRNFELGRMKGLGEMDPDEMAETVMSKETRTLKQITMEDAAEVAKTFMSLMGESVDPRKKFIENNAFYFQFSTTVFTYTSLAASAQSFITTSLMFHNNHPFSDFICIM